MKHFSFEKLRNWFGYTRRERRSSFILLMLIVAVAGIRFIIPERNMSVELIPLDSIAILAPSLQDQKPGAEVQESRQVKISQRQKTIVEINTCDSASLEALPGIGPVLSVRIIKYRNLLGGYSSADQLKEVYGLSEETYDLIKDRVAVDTTYIKKIIINSADYKQLIRLPYFERYEVSAILKYRELKGRLGSMDDLVENKLITADKVAKVRPYLEFGE